MTSTCDLDRGFVQAGSECVCQFGMYYFANDDEHKCVSADGCSDEEYLIYERDRTCISQEKCTALNKLVSLDGKFCKSLGDQNCEKEFGDRCGCNNFVGSDGASCVSKCGFFELHYEESVRDDSNLVKQQYCGHSGNDPTCGSDKLI